MMTVSDICDAVGRKALQNHLGVSKAAISNAVSAGAFPAGWYGVIHDMCSERGVECPKSAFSFRAPDMNSAA